MADAINSFPLECDFKGELTNIVDTINTIKNVLYELTENANRTKTLISLLNDGTFSLENVDENTLSALKKIIDSGLFGANQSGPILLLEKANDDYDSLTDIEKKQYSDLMSVLEKYGYITKEGFWNRSMYDFMESSEHGGCGFAANTNIIIDMYSKMENGEEEFYNTYGFPLYYTDSSGKKYYNYDALFASHYLNSIERYSNQIIPGFFNNEIPSFWPKWNPSAISYVLNDGTTTFQRLNALSNEFPNLSMDKTQYFFKKDITQYSSEYLNHDYAVVGVHNFTLTSMDGITTTYDGGHFMSITGVTSDGKYIVASWGEQYILDDYSFASLCFIDFR